MQEDDLRSAPVIRLLDELELRVTRSADLQREWRDAWTGFPGRAHLGGAARFREWFLLERESEVLGAIPAQVWTPEPVPEASPWNALLDNFLGIFQVVDTTETGELVLEDLWSGQALRWIPAEEQDVLGPESLIIGRFVLGAEGRHEALPGVYSCTAPGLPEAIERDLNAWRAEHPRSRLSQLECENLFAPLLGGGGAGGEAPGPGFGEGSDGGAADPEIERAHAEAQLSAVLDGIPGWDRESWSRLLEAEGPAGFLDRVAFETEVDLEQARRLVYALVADAGPALAPAFPGAPAEAGETGGGEAGTAGDEVRDVELALERYDRLRREGGDLEASFRQLEADLGLEHGASMEREETQPVGPVGAPAVEDLSLTFRWEREAAGSPLTASEEEALGALGDFLKTLQSATEAEPTAAEAAAASCLRRDRVLAFLLLAEDGPAFRRRSQSLTPFLGWCAREQDEPVGDLAEALAGGLGRKLELAVEGNRSMAEANRTASSQARVVGAGPVMVAAAGGERCAVEGIPEDCASAVEVDDLLAGTWRSGRFLAARWLPAEVLDAPDGA